MGTYTIKKRNEMTTLLYFIRHAEPNYDNHDDVTRELTEKGIVAS
ncbi:hypothetical protein HMPREF9964_2041 [Streptococcus dysgalactiae subsp. equisimilis SK1249]|nr:hypothetical protein HMPREF9964_2041 [Streptococcus dysgalactiae subsp. equisimilis SK1249]